MYRHVVLFSGGIDSLATVLKLSYAEILYFNAGFSHTEKDLKAIRTISKLLNRKIIVDNSLNLAKFERKDFGAIFCRNLLFTCVAGNYGDKIYMGAIRGDNALDKTPKAFKLMSKTISELGGKRLDIYSLYWDKTKTEIIKEILKYPNGKNLLLASVSCYASTAHHCGKCGSCFRRWVGMINNNIEEIYENDPWEWEQIPIYIKKMKKGLYDKTRTAETFLALRNKGVNI